MSLLLDALREAENRSRPELPEAAPSSSPPIRSDTNQPVLEQPLRLMEESGTSAPADAPAAGRSHAAAHTSPPLAAATPAPHPVRAHRWSRYLIFAALPLAGALYWTMFRGASAPVPALAPPMDSSLSEPLADEATELRVQELPLPTTSGTPELAAAASTSVPVAMPAPPPEPTVAPADAEPRATTATRPPAARQEPRAAAAATQPLQVIVERSSPLADAHVALRAGDLSRAETLYRAALASDPAQPDARLGMALIEQSRGAYAAAQRHYRAVLEQRPDDPQAWAGLADLAGDGELDAVESKLRTLIASRPDPALHFALGNVLVRSSRWPEAQESYFAAASGAPRNADYAFNVAVALDRLGKGRAAIPHYAQALALASDQRAVQFDTAAVRARLELLQSQAP